MFEYRTLQNVDLKLLHGVFVEAFSDYEVKLDLTIEKFSAMLIKNGFVPECSIGAFDKGKLSGFIINGVREQNGVFTAYDSGTGVIPSCRKMGVTTAMFEKLLHIFEEKHIRRYLLEVIKTNTPAVNLYRKLGFEATREFMCFKADKGALKLPEKSKFACERYINKIDRVRFESFLDRQPSWQNSFEAVTAFTGESAVVTAELGGELAGFGIIGMKSGSVYQLAVDQAFRRKGAGSAILRALLSITESSSVTFINVDSREKNTQAFLNACGFEVFTEQYEMVRPV